MVRNETKSTETNIVSEYLLLILKNKTQKNGVTLLKRTREDRAGGRKMEKEKRGVREREGR